MKLADTTEPSPEAMRAATALITGGKNEEYLRKEIGCEAWLSVDDADGDCLFADTTVPKLDGLEESLATIRRKVAIVIDRYMRGTP